MMVLVTGLLTHKSFCFQFRLRLVISTAKVNKLLEYFIKNKDLSNAGIAKPVPFYTWVCYILAVNGENTIILNLGLMTY